MQVSLKCINCGAALQVREGVSELACGYCGVQQVVQREGGAVWLDLEKAISDVKASADRAAAELALDRLSRERAEADRQRQSVLRRASKAEEGSIYSATFPLAMVLGMGFILFGFLRTLAPDVIESIGITNYVIILVVVGIAAAGVSAGLHLSKSRSAQEDADRDVLALDERISELDTQIEKHRRVVAN